MAYKLFRRLQRAAQAGAPEFFGPSTADRLRTQREERIARGPSPAQLSGIEKERTRQFRRMSFAPRGAITNQGVPDPFFRPRAPVSPQEAASEVTSRASRVLDKTGAPLVDFGSELNRFTAPDPMSFARGARAPEFVGQELDLGRAGVTEAELANRGTEIDLGFRPRQLEQQLDVGDLGLRTGEQGLTEAEAEAARKEQLFGSQLELAQQAPRLGEIEIEDAERRAAGAPPSDVLRTREQEDRETAQRLQRLEFGRAEREDPLTAMQADIDAFEEQGDFDRANAIRQQRNALLDNRAGPPAPGTAGGAPPSSRNINPAMLQRRGDEAEAIAQATGLERIIGSAPGSVNEVKGLLDEIAEDSGFPEAATLGKMETALAAIEQALAMATDEQTRNILKAEIRNSKGFDALKVRAGFTDTIGRNIVGTLGMAAFPPAGLARIATGSVRPQSLLATRKIAKQIVDLVEG